MRMSRNLLELAWSAGFYDGEGSVSCTANNGNHHTRVQLSIGQKNDPNRKPAATLRRFALAIGVGSIYKKVKKGPETQQSQYLISRRTDVEYALTLLWPYLSEAKRKQARYAFLLLDGGLSDCGLPERERNENF